MAANDNYYDDEERMGPLVPADRNGDIDHRYYSNSDNSDHNDKPRYLNDLVKGRASNFFVNGDPFFPGKRLVYNPKYFKDFPNYLDYLTDKLDPKFGAVRKICTPRYGHRIRDLRDLQENGDYVVAGRERFKPYQYDQITPSERKRSPPFKYDADPVYHSRQYVSSGKINKCETHSILIKVWPNGGDLRGPRRVLLTPRIRPFTLPNVVNAVNEMLKEDCLGTVEKLFFLNGIKVSDVDQITQNGQYVACRKTERFKRAHYNEQGTKNIATSPRLERKLLAPLYSRSNNSTSQSSPEQSNASTQNSVNGYSQQRRRGHRRDEDQVFPAKPVKHTRSSEKVRPVDLDNDQGGVFKSKQANRNTRGAREIQDSRHTRTDLPVDQREAREVEEEEIFGTPPNRAQSSSVDLEEEIGAERKQSNRVRHEERIRGRDNPRKDYQQRDANRRGGVEAKANSKRATPPKNHKKDDEEVKRKQSATRIQANYRGYKTRQQLNKKPTSNDDDRLAEEEKAAAKIQAGYRGHQTRKHVSQSRSPARNARTPSPRNNDDEHRAASKIQAGYRGHQSRKESRSRHSLHEEDKAAAKIQAGFRGHQTRKQLQKEREAATKIQSGYRGHNSRKSSRSRQSLNERENFGEEDMAAAKIQAGFRGHQTRKRISQEKEAATKIQSGYRGHLSRNSSRQKPQSRGRDDDPFAEEERAAAKIQASYRGHMTRKEIEARKRSAKRSAQRQLVSPEPTYDELDRENDAAIKIQSQYRGYRARKDYAGRRAAAVKSQSFSPPLVSSDGQENENSTHEEDQGLPLQSNSNPDFQSKPPSSTHLQNGEVSRHGTLSSGNLKTGGSSGERRQSVGNREINLNDSGQSAGNDDGDRLESV